MQRLTTSLTSRSTETPGRRGDRQHPVAHLYLRRRLRRHHRRCTRSSAATTCYQASSRPESATAGLTPRRTTPAPARFLPQGPVRGVAGVRCRRRSDEFAEAASTLQAGQPLGRPTSPASGSPGQDWCNGAALSTTHGGDFAVQEDGEWTGALSEPDVAGGPRRGPGPLHRRDQRAAGRRLQRALDPVQQRRGRHVLRADLGPVEHRPAAVQPGRRPGGPVRGGDGGPRRAAGLQRGADRRLPAARLG